MGANGRKRHEPSPGLFQCSVCRGALPRSAFLEITVRDKRCKPGHELKAFTADCRECRNKVKRQGRRLRAEESGKQFISRGNAATWKAHAAANREQKKVQRQIAWAICVAFRTLVAIAPQEKARRAVARQRERYNTDPSYQAAIKAKKIRRKRAQKGTQVEPVNRELVAQRDGWCCGICRLKVTRATWSLDHVIPLSKGGSHTYDNVVLAHRRCNSRRGAGRLPVQAALFAHPTDAGVA